jgi:allantoate deiminase
VPGAVILSLDARHADDAVRAEHSTRLMLGAQAIAKRRGLSVKSTLVAQEDTLPCSPRLTSLLARAVEELDRPAIELASGAGHDAVVMARLTDVAMLFVRCQGGISHHPAESVTEADVTAAIDVLGKFLELLATER